MELGKKIWVFADGDLPPQGDREPLGHEALMIVNNGNQEANIELDILFEDAEPKSGIKIQVPAKRVKCFRMDYPIGEENYQIPSGQYAVILHSDLPVVCLYGRLDRRPDMAYYPIAGFAT
jgi:hypothetical protein